MGQLSAEFRAGMRLVESRTGNMEVEREDGRRDIHPTCYTALVFRSPVRMRIQRVGR